MTTPRTWDTQTLVYAEAAVQTHFARSRRRERTLTLSDFCQIVQSIPFVPSEKVNESRESENGNEIFSREETVLLDLLYSSTPTLYKLININEELLVEISSFNGNRVEKLRQLCSTLETSSTKNHRDFQSRIREQKLKRKQLEQEKRAKDSGGGGEIPSSSVFGKDMPFESSVQIDASMTLEERVEARGKAKKSLQDLKKNSSGSTDDSLLRLADALWAHSRNGRLRKSRFLKTSPSSNVANSPCIMTLKEIVSNFSTSMFTTTRATHKEVVEAVIELHRRAPEWIILSSSKDTKTLRKNTTVRINHIDNYQAIRVQFGGAILRKPSKAIRTPQSAPSLKVSKNLSPLLLRTTDTLQNQGQEDSSNLNIESTKSLSEISRMIMKRTEKRSMGKATSK